jgi:hemerythrin
MGNQASLLQQQQPVQCDAECQRQKRIIELKSAYQTAMQDETKDSDEVRLARKQYYTYTYGQNAFDGLEEKALSKTADANIQKLQTKHDELIKEIKEQKVNNKSYSIALKNMDELLSKYQTSNNTILSSLDKQEDTLETSRRNVWYTNQRIDRLDYYGYFISMVLNILLLIAIVFFMYDKKYVSLIVVVVSAVLITKFA